jgi:hypothetical protein
LDFKNINQKSGGSFLCKTVLKLPDFVREQGANRFISGAYTTVREHFETVRSAARGQKMAIYKQF